MKILFPLLFATTVFATSLTAQSADVRVAVDVSTEPVHPGDVVPFTVTIENLGPDAAANVRFTAGGGRDVCIDQVIATLAAGETRTTSCQAVVPSDEFAMPCGAHALMPAIESDPNYGNNDAGVLVRILTPPDLIVYSFPEPVVDAGLPYRLDVGYANRSLTDATNVTITVRGAEPAGTLPDNCSVQNGAVVCAIGVVHAPQIGQSPDFRTISFEVLAPDASAQPIALQLQIKGDEADFAPETNVSEAATRTYRTYFVTNTNDDGSGSLRQAINTANADCHELGYCKIAFRIPPAGANWQTIAPRSPLPLLVAPGIDVDALVQTRYFAETNEVGPDVEISGANVTSGNGIEFACIASVRGLAINGFPGAAIQSSAAACATPTATRLNHTPTVERNYLGTDPTGMTAVPNMRGIHLDNAGVALISDNVISGNLRSGIFIESGNALIRRNIIGLNRVPSAGLGNGASGIYFGRFATGSDVTDNYIGFNAHFGISLHPETRYNAFTGNSFQANHNQAIDFGLDGPTEQVPDASNSGFVLMPEITSARYDATRDETIIEGKSRTANDRYEVWVNLYANDERDPSGYGEGQYYLGRVQAGQDQSFRFVIRGRAPGRWVAATTTRINIIGLAGSPRIDSICSCGFTSTTSEFGRAVEVIE